MFINLTLRPLTLRLRAVHHRLLCLLSSVVRNAAQTSLDLAIARQDLATRNSELSRAQRELAEARAQLQSLTAAAQNSQDLSARLRLDLDRALQEALEARKGEVRASQCVADWLAQQQTRRPIYGVGPEPSASSAVSSSGLHGRMHARDFTREATAKVIRELEKDLLTKVSRMSDPSEAEAG